MTGAPPLATEYIASVHPEFEARQAASGDVAALFSALEHAPADLDAERSYWRALWSYEDGMLDLQRHVQHEILLRRAGKGTHAWAEADAVREKLDNWEDTHSTQELAPLESLRMWLCGEPLAVAYALAQDAEVDHPRSL